MKKIVIILVLLIVAVGAFVMFGEDKTQNNSKDFPERSQPDQEMTTDEPVGDISDTVVNGELGEYDVLTFPDNTLDTSNWETYQNEDFGFEVKYPADWEVDDEIENLSRVIFWPVSRQGADDRGTYTIISDKSLESFVQDANANPKDYKFVGKFSHNEVAGVTVETKLGVWDESYPFPDDRETIKQYTFNTGNHRVTFYSPSIDESFDSVFEQILLSFKLVK